MVMFVCLKFHHVHLYFNLCKTVLQEKGASCHLSHLLFIVKFGQKFCRFREELSKPISLDFIGTAKERGIKAWRKQLEPDHDLVDDTPEQSEIYDIPVITQWLKKTKWAAYIPFLPTFQTKSCRLIFCSCKSSDEY